MPRNPARLEVYGRAYELAMVVYGATGTLPNAEEFGLKAQLRRAAVSVVANIAEGAARPSAREFGRFLGIALGSAVELRCLLDLAVDLRLLTSEGAARSRAGAELVVRMLLKLRSTVIRFDQ